MKKLTSALVLASALLVGAAAPSSAAEPPKNCQGQLVSFAVRLFDGRREVASAFFGDYPQAGGVYNGSPSIYDLFARSR